MSSIASASFGVGSPLPNPNVVIMGKDQTRQIVSLHDLLGEKETGVIFSVPGAFTPVCSKTHLPSFIAEQAALKELVCKTFCISTDTINTLEAWKKTYPDQAAGVIMVSDRLHQYGKATDLLIDNPTLGPILKRSSMVVHKRKIAELNIEAETGHCNISSGTNTAQQVAALIKAQKSKPDDQSVPVS